MTSANQPQAIRILHVLGALNRGGGETWLMNVLRNIDRSIFKFDFLVHTTEPAVFDAEVQSLGCRILRLRPPRQSAFSYLPSVGRILKTEGPFDVVHSHNHFFSGHILRRASQVGVNARIAHSHTTDDSVNNLPLARRTIRKMYQSVSRRALLKYATGGLACSPAAAAALYGSNWQQDPRWQVLPYGFDFSRFADLPSKSELRRELKIPEDKLLIGHVGRLVEVKNHKFIVEILASLHRSGTNAHLLLVGGGPLEGQIRSQLESAGLTEHATLAGDQANVLPFLGAMDVKLFPSFYEGFGIVILEAQAAGVPSIISDRVPREVGIIPGMVECLPLEAGADVWADAVVKQQKRAISDRKLTSRTLSDSEYGISTCVERLSNVYLNSVRHMPLQKNEGPLSTAVPAARQ